MYRNRLFGKAEIDIIAAWGDLLVFVEVKTRNGTGFGFPEDAVGPRKQDMMKVAAALFMADNPAFTKVQFDIVSILIKGGNLKEIVHIEDAFY